MPRRGKKAPSAPCTPPSIPRTRYRLTPSGEELEVVIQAVDRWARKRLRAPV